MVVSTLYIQKSLIVLQIITTIVRLILFVNPIKIAFFSILIKLTLHIIQLKEE